MTFLKVVVLNADEEDEGEPEEKGPSYVVSRALCYYILALLTQFQLFNEIIYQKINLDPVSNYTLYAPPVTSNSLTAYRL